MGKRKGTPAVALHESSEAWRLLGSLELLAVPTKAKLGGMIVDLLPKRKFDKVRSPMVWALGRIGQRVPVYGPLNTVVPVQDVATWIDAMINNPRTGADVQLSTIQSTLMQLARRTNDRYRDVDETLRKEVVNWLSESDASDHLVELVNVGGELDTGQQAQVFGESLPKGLSLRQ